MRWGGSPKLTLIDYDFDYASPSGITSDSYAWYTFEYNSEDQLTRFGTQFGTLLGTADIVQNNVGRLDEKSYTYEENGVPVFYNKVTYEYTSSNAQIESVTVVRGTSASTASATAEYQFTYDANGNITHIYDGNGELLCLYCYDDLGQLIREDNYLIDETYVYTYDAAGNRTATYTNGYATDGGMDPAFLEPNVTYEYNGDRLWYMSEGSSGFSYDTIGNLTYYGDYYYYEFDWQGRELIASREIDSFDNAFYGGEIIISNEATYTYNANGIRTSKTVNGIKHEYVLDGAQIIAETWVENNTEYMMVFLYDDMGSPVGFLYRTSTYARNQYDAYFYEKNFFGDVTAIYNESGSCVARYAYNAWGEHTITYNSNGIAEMNPIRYRGYYYDTHTGLYYLQSRYYNPAWGRFISADCYVSTSQGLLGNNMYIYCNNNPVNCKQLSTFCSASATTTPCSSTMGTSASVNNGSTTGTSSNTGSAFAYEGLQTLIGALPDIVLGVKYLAAKGMHNKFAYVTSTRFMYPIMGGSWRWFSKSSSSFSTIAQGTLRQMLTGDARAGLGAIAKSVGGVVGLNALVNFGFNLYENNWEIDAAMLKDTLIDTTIGTSAYFLATGSMAIITTCLVTGGVALPGIVVVGGIALLSVGFDWAIREIFDYHR